MPRDATVTESRFLAFCEDYARTNGRAPTVRELMDGVGVQNPTGASRALRKHVHSTYEKAFANGIPDGVDPQLLQRVQELQEAVTEVGNAELAREREAFASVKAAKDEEVVQAMAERGEALQRVEATRQEMAVFNARTTEEIAAKTEQIEAFRQQLEEARQTQQSSEKALAKAREDIAEASALLRQLKASSAQQLLEAEERQEAALKQQAARHAAELRKRDEDLMVAHRERRRTEDNLVIANTKLGIAEKTVTQLRQQLEAAQGHVTARAVAEQAEKDALTRAERAEGESAELRTEGRRQAEALARLKAENAMLLKLADSQDEKRSAKD